MEKTNHSKQTIELLKELDDLIQRDYEQALAMLEEFKQQKFEEPLDNPLQLTIFDTQTA